MSAGADQDLVQFLQLCRLEHLHAALVDAGVEQVEDLRRYYHELKELSPEDFREEMVATLRCKKIELSRLITAIDKLSPRAGVKASPAAARARPPSSQSRTPSPALPPNTLSPAPLQPAQVAQPVRTTAIAMPVVHESQPAAPRATPLATSSSLSNIAPLQQRTSSTAALAQAAQDAATTRRSASVRLPEPLNVQQLQAAPAQRRHSLDPEHAQQQPVQQQPQQQEPPLRIATPVHDRPGSAASNSSAGSGRRYSFNSLTGDVPGTPTIHVEAYAVLGSSNRALAVDDDDDDDENEGDRPEGDAAPPPPPPTQPPPVQLPAVLNARTAISTSRRITLADVAAVATVQHYGMVKKQAKYRTKVWHDRFLLLHDNSLYRFKSQRSFQHHDTKAVQTLHLNATMQCVRAANNTFIVGNEVESWKLQAETPEEVQMWVNVINAHCYNLYLQAHRLNPESFPRNTTSFPQSMYYALHHSAAKMMGVRAAPIFRGPRTGGTVAPDEIFEVVGVFPANADPNSVDACLQLADDRGWICQMSTPHGPIVVPAVGTEVPEFHRFVVRSDLRQRLPLLHGPSMLAESTGAFLNPGDSFYACKRWVTSGLPAAVFLKIDASRPTGRGERIAAGSWIQVYREVGQAPQERSLMALVIAEDEDGHTSPTAPPPPPSLL